MCAGSSVFFSLNLTPNLKSQETSITKSSMRGPFLYNKFDKSDKQFKMIVCYVDMLYHVMLPMSELCIGKKFI